MTEAAQVATSRRTCWQSQVEEVMNCCSCWESTPRRAAIGSIDLRWPLVSSPRTYSWPLARWSQRGRLVSISPVNLTSRGRTRVSS